MSEPTRRVLVDEGQSYTAVMSCDRCHDCGAIEMRRHKTVEQAHESAWRCEECER